MAFAAGIINDPTRAPGNEPLTIVGASSRAAAWSARRAFFAPVTGDLFADLDLCETARARRVNDYPRDLEAVLRDQHAGGWMFCGGLENDPELIERWSRVRPLYGNSAATVQGVRDPWQVARCLNQSGLSCPELASDEAALPRDGAWLRKPLRSAGGQHIVRLDDSTPSADRPVYYQKLVHGPSCSAAFIAARGESRLLAVTEQMLSPGSYRYCGSIGPSKLPADMHEQWERIGAVISRHFSMVGLFGVDAVLADGVVLPVEVNPRYTASMEVLERSLGFSAVGYHVAACRDGRLPDEIPASRSTVVGKQIVFAERQVIVLDDLRRQLMGIADVPRPGESISPGAPVLTVIRSGQSHSEAATLLAAGVAAARLVIGQQ
jgi:predicted ATP-grasp superfamily ATP-dependent carboligase